MAEEIKQAESKINLLDLIKRGDLGPDQKAHLRKILLDRKRQVERLRNQIDLGLKLLQPKPRKIAKRKGAKRAAKPLR
jgi:hypothetical protein